MLTSPDYDDARLSAMLERAKDRSRALRQRQHRWQAVAAGASAAILVAGGAWYGLAARPGGAGHPAEAVKELTAVHGCPGLAAASGMLERVHGGSLVLKTPGGAPVTVITTASSTLRRQVTGTVRDITTGTRVIVAGTGTGGAIAARSVVIGAQPRLHGLPPTHRRGHPSQHGRWRSPARGGRADGTVTAVRTGSFTVLTSGGLHIRVATSGSTTVYAQATSTVGQLQDGEFTIAVGRAKSDGTLAAAAVEQGNLIPRFEHGGGIVPQPWLGCSPAAIATAAFLAAG